MAVACSKDNCAFSYRVEPLDAPTTPSSPAPAWVEATQRQADPPSPALAALLMPTLVATPHAAAHKRRVRFAFALGVDETPSGPEAEAAARAALLALGGFEVSLDGGPVATHAPATREFTLDAGPGKHTMALRTVLANGGQLPTPTMYVA